MIDADALAKRLLDAVSEIGESAVVTVKAGAEAEREMARIIVEHLSTDVAVCEGTGKAEWARLRQLERVVLNQLGTTDPKQVAEWIVDARRSLRMLESRSTFVDPRLVETLRSAPLDVPSHVARCAPTPEPQPQADGEPAMTVVHIKRAMRVDEQDVIGLLRGYNASVDGC